MPKILFLLNGGTWYSESGGETDSEKEWERPEVEKPIQRKNEIGGPGGGSLLPCLSCWADENRGEKVNQREWETERGGEHRLERKVRFLGIWVVLFVLICDCFVVNILDRICSLSGWFLVCLEDNNVWFTKIFVFLVKRMCQIFVIHLKLIFFFLTPSYFLKFWGLPST